MSEKKKPLNHFVNRDRTPAQRRVRYCFLRQLGLPRNVIIGIYGRSDPKIVETLWGLSKAGDEPQISKG